MKKNTMEYTAPEMEIVLATVENGFSNSPFGEEGMAGQSLGFNDYEEEF